jgi:hypothetical protein
MSDTNEIFTEYGETSLKVILWNKKLSDFKFSWCTVVLELNPLGAE